METTVQAAAAGALPAPPVGRKRRIVRIWLRIASVAVLVAGLLQAMFAGKFLSGNYDALDMHKSNGAVLGALTVVLLLAAIVDYWLSRVALWPILVTIAIFAADGAQVELAKSNLLELHVPLGIAAIVAMALLVFGVWRLPLARPVQAVQA